MLTENRLKPWHYVMLALAAFCFLTPGIAHMPPIDRDEARFLQASKQMLESGDFIDIRFQKQHRYKKPVGIYWLQTAAVTLSGGDAKSDIWRYRLVSVAAGIASVLLIAMMGAKMFGANAGLAAGIMLASLFGLAFEGRIAKTDATLLALTLLAQTALAYIYFSAKDKTHLSPFWPYVLWIAVGIGILIKGPLTLAIVALTIAVLVLFDRDRGWLSNLKPVWAVAIIVAIAAPWLVAIIIKSDGAFWVESVGIDMLGKAAAGQESHWGPPGYYVLTYSLYMWPFGFLAILGGLKGLNVWREPRILYCLAWYVPFWLIMEAVPTKLPHYLMPVYPALLLLSGWALFGDGKGIALKTWQKWLGWLTVFGLFVVTLAFAGVSTAGVWWATGSLSLSGTFAAIFACAACWWAIDSARPNRGLKPLALAALSAAAFYIVAFSFVLPGLNPLWISRTVAEKLNVIEGCAEIVLASIDFQEPSLVFLNGTNTLLTDLEGVAQHLGTGTQCAFALIPSDKISDLQALIGEVGKLQETQQITGLNYSKGAELSMVLVRLVR